MGLPTSRFGLALGNVPRFTGVRINVSDIRVERVDGINLSLWLPRQSDRAVYHGLMLGLVAHEAEAMRGITVSGIGLATGELSGVGIALVGMGAERAYGVALNGIGFAVERRFIGLGVAGIGADVGRFTGAALGGIGVGGGDMEGVALGGIGVGGGDMTGLFLGGVGVGGEDMTGLFFGGIGVGGQRLRGVFAGGLGVGGEDLTGLFAGGLGVGGDRITGFTAAGIGTGANRFCGVSLNAGMLRIGDGDTRGRLQGLGVAAFTHVRGRQDGVTVGFINIAEELHGVQIGLLNYAGNNPDGLKLLPGFNAHFRP